MPNSTNVSAEALALLREGVSEAQSRLSRTRAACLLAVRGSDGSPGDFEALVGLFEHHRMRAEECDKAHASLAALEAALKEVPGHE